jgi:hypothetical protein
LAAAPERLERCIAGLVEDGLAVERDGGLILP